MNVSNLDISVHMVCCELLLSLSILCFLLTHVRDMAGIGCGWVANWQCAQNLKSTLVKDLFLYFIW